MAYIVINLNESLVTARGLIFNTHSYVYFLIQHKWQHFLLEMVPLTLEVPTADQLLTSPFNL